MAVQTKVGTISDGTGVKAITGLGFKPKAIIFWTNLGYTSANTWDPNAALGMGFCAGPDNQYAGGISSANSVGTAVSSRAHSYLSSYVRNTANSATWHSMRTVSFDSDGFTVDVTANAGLYCHYMAIGGSDITDARVISWSMPAANDSVKSVTSVGFKPDLVFHATASTTAYNAISDGILSYGVMNKHGQQWANGISSMNGQTGALTSRAQLPGTCLLQVANSQVLVTKAHYQSMDEDGFTVRFSTNASAYYVYSLCLKGISSDIGTFNKTTVTAANTTQTISRIGFNPRALITSNYSTTPGTGLVSGAYMAFGATDGTTERVSAYQDDNGANPTQAAGIYFNNASIYMPGGAQQSVARASVALGTDSFTATWAYNNNEPREVQYVALGDAEQPTNPSRLPTWWQVTSTGTDRVNQHKVDRTQDGTLWAVVPGGTVNQLEYFYSKDEGVTWTNKGSLRTDIWAGNASIFIDLDDYMHVAWTQSITSGSITSGNVYYSRGTPNASRTGYTFTSPMNISSVATMPDIIAHKSGSGWKVHITCIASNTFLQYHRLNVANAGTITQDAGVNLRNYSPNSIVHPCIDFHHTGDGKTVKNSDPHIFIGCSAGPNTTYGIRFFKITHASGVWTVGTEREIDAAMYVNDAIDDWWFNLFFDGTRVVMGGHLWGGASILRIWERDVADTTTTQIYTSGNLSGGTYWFGGSMTYDQAGNIYVLGSPESGATSFTLQLAKWTRGVGMNAPILIGPLRTRSYPSFKRGSSYGKIEWIYIMGTNQPYQVMYNSHSEFLNNTKPTITVTGPADNSSQALNSTFVQFTWTMGNSAGTQRAYAFRRRKVGTSEWEYWDGRVTRWISNMVYSENTVGVTSFPNGYWPKGSWEYQIRVRDTLDQVSDWSSVRTVINSENPEGVQIKVGSFTKPTSPGGQTISGVGFRPKAVIFWTGAANTASSGTWTPAYDAMIGVTSGIDESWSCSSGGADNLTVTNTTRRVANRAIAMSYQETQFEEANLSGFTSDGFTLDWLSANSVAWGANVQINYMAIGGAEVEAKAHLWGLTGSGTKDVTDVGFKPDFVMMASTVEPVSNVGSANTYAILGYGFANKYGQQWSNSFISVDNATPANTSRWSQVDACLTNVSATEGKYNETTFIKMLDGGFRVNTHWFSYECAVVTLSLRGVESKIGSFNKSIAAAPATDVISRAGFTPKGVISGNAGSSGMTSPSQYAIWTIGASDGTTQRIAAIQDVDGANPSQADSVWLNNGAMYEMNVGVTPTTASIGSVALNSDGFTTTWNPNYTGGSAQIDYVILGEANPSRRRFPSLVGITASDNALTFPGSQRKMDRFSDGSILQVFWEGTRSSLALSRDGGKIWRELYRSRGIFNGAYPLSIFIDQDDYIHAAWRSSQGNSLTEWAQTAGSLYYARGYLDDQGEIVWSATTVIATDTSVNTPDLIAFRNPGSNPTTWSVCIVASHNNAGPSNYALYERLTIANDGTVTSGLVDGLGSVWAMGMLGGTYGVNMPTYPSIDFHHIGDGKTVKDGTPHIYVGWSAGATGTGKGIRFRKATYSGGNWTWNNEREINNTQYIVNSSAWITCMFNGTKVLIAGRTYTGSNSYFLLMDRDVADTGSNSLVGTLDDTTFFQYGSCTYDNAGNAYWIGRNPASGELCIRKYTAGVGLGAAVKISKLTHSTHETAAVFRRGHWRGNVEWAFNMGNQSPFLVYYDNLDEARKRGLQMII